MISDRLHIIACHYHLSFWLARLATYIHIYIETAWLTYVTIPRIAHGAIAPTLFAAATTLITLRTPHSARLTLILPQSYFAYSRHSKNTTISLHIRRNFPLYYCLFSRFTRPYSFTAAASLPIMTATCCIPH